MHIHVVFDFLASMASLGMTLAVYRWRLQPDMQRVEQAGYGYAAALLIGAAAGGYGFGTLNLWLGGNAEIGRSIVGALAGGIAGVELFKHWNGLKGSTGIIFVPAFCATVIVGRWGCFLSGLEDETHGTATSLPWGVDLGDGVLRHPVQLYESFAMLAFLIFALVMLARRNQWFLANGFYLLVLFYAAQRFLWEFLKPYATLAGPFNLFHLVSAGLIGYAFVMLGKRHERTAP